jgi:ketosteroid isomerase-like protein
MMESSAARGAVFGAVEDTPDAAGKPESRFDLANLHIQRYNDTAIASYTLLISTSLPTGVQVVAHNETRVMVQNDSSWKVVHVHKSPAWDAPHIQP